MAATRVSSTQTLYAFNKILADAIIDLKKISPELKALFKENYRAGLDMQDPSHITHWKDNMPRDVILETHPSEIFENDSILQFEMFKNITVRKLLSFCTDENVVKNFLYTLYLIVIIYTDFSNDETALPRALMDIQKVTTLSKDDDSDSEDTETTRDENDVVHRVLEKLKLVARSSEKPADGGAPSAEEASSATEVPPFFDEALRKLQGSKIGSLAREISEEIDVSQFNVSNPMDLLNLNNLADQNSPVGSIVSKVGSKIQQKLKNGEINQSDLINEAMQLMQSFDAGGSGGLSSLIKNFMGGSGAAAAAAASSGSAGGGLEAQLASAMQALTAMSQKTHSGGATRERLRRKLEQQRSLQGPSAD